MPEHYETRTWPDRPKRKWQNLLHKKCPNCSSRLDQDKHRRYFICPNPSPTDATRSCFFIKKETAASLLLNPDHPANFCLSAHEKATIDQVIADFGITDPNFMQNPVVESNYEQTR